MLEQDPAAGTELAKGKTVDLVVAKAPAELPVPDVGGLTEDDATQALEDAGFEVDDRGRRRRTSADEDGLVIEQDPARRRDAAQGLAR